jgi:hypothetical protein
MLCLVSLPYEVLAYIVSNIDFEDVFNLGVTCKALKFLLAEESICKSTVQVRPCAAVTFPDCGNSVLTEVVEKSKIY